MDTTISNRVNSEHVRRSCVVTTTGVNGPTTVDAFVRTFECAPSPNAEYSEDVFHADLKRASKSIAAMAAKARASLKGGKARKFPE